MTPLLINIMPDFGDVGWLVTGILGVQAWQWIKCKWKDHRDPEGKPHVMKKLNWYYVWVAVVFAVIVAVSIQNARTYTFAERLARDTQACQIEFNQYLVRSRSLNTEDRRLDRAQDEATYKRSRELIELQQVYGGTSPQYFERKVPVDTLYFNTLSSIEKARNNLEDERQANPLPDPLCGRK